MSLTGLQEQHSSYSHRQYHSSCLYINKEVWPSVCPSVENTDLVYQQTGYSQSPTHNRPSECGSRQAIQARPDHSNRVVSPSGGLPSNMQQVAPTSNRPFCDKVQQQTSPVCVTSPGLPRPGQSMHSETKSTIFTKWYLSNKVDFSAPPIKSVADFLMYLFQNRKLKPSTIDGYRSAIANKLGNSPINVSKDENLTHLLDNFHRDRPKGRRTIHYWNLYLMLHHLTKAPFKPIKEAVLKHLTFKTAFLFALGSSKRWSEIHAW